MSKRKQTVPAGWASDDRHVKMHRLKVTEFNSYVKEDLMCFLLLLLRAQQV